MTEFDIAGIDAGLSLLKPTSGVCRTGVSGDSVAHTYCDYFSRLSALGIDHSYAVISIDAPILPGNRLHYNPRACEKVFVCGAFQTRCKPGESHVDGTGRALRRAGADTVHSLGSLTLSTNLPKPIPQVIEGLNIVEAFPNAFLGVCLPDNCFTKGIGRSGKFDWLYDQWLLHKGMEKLQRVLEWPRESFWQLVSSNSQHDERAALLCASTAIGAFRGRYVAVGESVGGYFFLPTWELWEPWAKTMLDKNRSDKRMSGPISVWIDGEEIPTAEALPK